MDQTPITSARNESGSESRPAQVTTPKQVLLQAIANSGYDQGVVSSLLSVVARIGDGTDSATWRQVADALIALLPSRSIGMYSRYFPRSFLSAYPQYVQFRVAPLSSPAWYTPSAASLSLAIDDKDWSGPLIEVLGSDYVYSDTRIRRAISKAFKEGKMLETAEDLGISTFGRSKRAIMADIVRYFKPVTERRRSRRRSSSRV